MQQNIRQAGPSLQLSDLKSLRVFMTIADCGGLSAAQAKLGWSLSHISAILSNFEQRFGVRLCERGRSGFSLTPEGQHIYESSARLLQTLSVFESDLAAFRGILTGTLCIAGHGGDVTHERYVLPKVIRRFLSRDQNMANLRFETGSQDVIVNGVLNGTIDVAIGYFPAAQVGVAKYRLYAEKACLYCGRGHSLYDRADSVSPEEVATHDLVMRSETFPPFMPAVLRNAPVRAIAPTQEGRALLVLSDKFLAFLPEHLAAPWVASGDMRRVGSNEFSYEINVEMITRDAKRPSVLIASFLEDYTLVTLEEGFVAPRLWHHDH